MIQTGDPRSPKSIAIVGAGIIGMSLAWRLAQAGFKVSVFDKGTPGSEASWAGAGMLSPGGEVEGPSSLASLAIESRQIYSAFVQELEKASGLHIDYQECGALDLAYSEEEFATLNRRAERQQILGIESKALTPEQVRTFWPRVRNEGLNGARFYPTDGLVNPREVMAALSLACNRQGVRISSHCAVGALTILTEQVMVEHERGSEIYAAAVIAAGAWSSSIAVGAVPPLPVAEPVKGHLIGYVQPEQTCGTILRYGHTYLMQRSNGLLIAGASIEYEGFDRAVRPEIAASLAESAGFVLPHLNETAPSEVWIGFRPGSEQLHIGSWHSKRLYLAYGHYRNGILLAPVTARRLAAEITANLQTQ